MEDDYLYKAGDWYCWCCKRTFRTIYTVFKRHLDGCEMKVIGNPEEYDKEQYDE